MGSENKICFLFHSTHPRRVWRIVLVSLILVQTVSIHTPTKGVTEGYGVLPVHWLVSIHTPTKGVTHQEDVDYNLLRVSIHTPTKGVTYLFVILRLTSVVSIHTPTKGVTMSARFFLAAQISFNPHTHEGCDPHHQIRKPPYLCFNPHTHEGCDRASWTASLSLP